MRCPSWHAPEVWHAARPTELCVLIHCHTCKEGEVVGADVHCFQLLRGLGFHHLGDNPLRVTCTLLEGLHDGDAAAIACECGNEVERKT